MSDKFINTYVDFAIGTIHEQLNNILQLKTQLKIANDLILEKDGVINALTQENNSTVGDLNTEIKTLKDEVSTIDSLRRTISNLTTENEALKSKSSHIDTCLNQVSEMKKEIISRDEIIKQKNEEIAKLKNKSEKVSLKSKETSINKKKETNSLDDF